MKPFKSGLAVMRAQPPADAAHTMITALIHRIGRQTSAAKNSTHKKPYKHPPQSNCIKKPKRHKPQTAVSEPSGNGGRYWTRTSDPLHVKQVL